MSIDPHPAGALDALYTAAVKRDDQLEARKIEQALEELREARRPITPSTETAIWYASWGWPVFPLKTWRKVPAIPAVHPVDSPERATCRGECGQLGHGVHDATTKTGAVQTIFKRSDSYNIGIATGHLFDAIDIDPEGHAEVIRRLADDPTLLAMPLLGIAQTPRGGFHLWVPPTGRGNTAHVWPGVDYRGLGGYVVAPPSYVDDGKVKGAYRWLLAPMLPAGG